MNKKFVGYISNEISVSPRSSATASFTNTENGRVRIKEIAAAWDTILQSEGRYTLTVCGSVISNYVKPLSVTNGFVFHNMNTDFPKNSNITLTFYNNHTNNYGSFQLQINAYKETEG